MKRELYYVKSNYFLKSPLVGIIATLATYILFGTVISLSAPFFKAVLISRVAEFIFMGIQTGNAHIFALQGLTHLEFKTLRGILEAEPKEGRNFSDVVLLQLIKMILMAYPGAPAQNM